MLLIILSCLGISGSLFAAAKAPEPSLLVGAEVAPVGDVGKREGKQEAKTEEKEEVKISVAMTEAIKRRSEAVGKPGKDYLNMLCIEATVAKKSLEIYLQEIEHEVRNQVLLPGRKIVYLIDRLKEIEKNQSEAIALEAKREQKNAEIPPECGVCFGVYDAADTVVLLCGHAQHNTCLKASIVDAVTTKDLEKIKCMTVGCEHSLNEHEIRKAASDAIEDFIMVRDTLGRSPFQALTDDDKAAFAGFFDKLCPFCNTGINKTGGCKYVICQDCTGTFCWECGYKEFVSKGAELAHPCSIKGNGLA